MWYSCKKVERCSNFSVRLYEWMNLWMKYINDARYYYLPLNVVWPVSYITTIYSVQKGKNSSLNFQCLLYVQKTSLNMWSKDKQRQSTIYIQTKIAKSLSPKNDVKMKIISLNCQIIWNMKIHHYEPSRRQMLLNYFKMVETQNLNICTQ